MPGLPRAAKFNFRTSARRQRASDAPSSSLSSALLFLADARRHSRGTLCKAKRVRSLFDVALVCILQGSIRTPLGDPVQRSRAHSASFPRAVTRSYPHF